jgi:hypothetical protein
MLLEMSLARPPLHPLSLRHLHLLPLRLPALLPLGGTLHLLLKLQPLRPHHPLHLPQLLLLLGVDQLLLLRRHLELLLHLLLRQGDNQYLGEPHEANQKSQLGVSAPSFLTKEQQIE